MIVKPYKFNFKKGSGEAMFTGKGTPDIAFKVQKSGNDDYVIMPATPLKPGEYGLMNMMMAKGSGRKINYTVFAFGIEE